MDASEERPKWSAVDVVGGSSWGEVERGGRGRGATSRSLSRGEGHFAETNPGRPSRKRAAMEADATSTNTFRPGQVVAVEAAAFGNFDGITRGTVQKPDEFGRVVSRHLCGKSVRRTKRKRESVSHIPTTLGVL